MFNSFYMKTTATFILSNILDKYVYSDRSMLMYLSRMRLFEETSILHLFQTMDILFICSNDNTFSLRSPLQLIDDVCLQELYAYMRHVINRNPLR